MFSFFQFQDESTIKCDPFADIGFDFQNGIGCGSRFIGRCCSNYITIYRFDWCFLLFHSWTFSTGKFLSTDHKNLAHLCDNNSKKKQRYGDAYTF